MNPLAEIFRYNRWANEQLLAASQALSDAQLDAPISGADNRPIRVQLMHFVGGQQTFVLRTMAASTRANSGHTVRGRAGTNWHASPKPRATTSSQSLRRCRTTKKSCCRG